VGGGGGGGGLQYVKEEAAPILHGLLDTFSTCARFTCTRGTKGKDVRCVFQHARDVWSQVRSVECRGRGEGGGGALSFDYIVLAGPWCNLDLRGLYVTYIIVIF
jgi:hypothetical protein